MHRNTTHGQSSRNPSSGANQGTWSCEAASPCRRISNIYHVKPFRTLVRRFRTALYPRWSDSSTAISATAICLPRCPVLLGCTLYMLLHSRMLVVMLHVISAVGLLSFAVGMILMMLSLFGLVTQTGPYAYASCHTLILPEWT